MLHEFVDMNGKMHDYELCGAEQWDNTVDVLMLAYNHGKYIAQAIESILMQKTAYTYHIIIGEDCSTDETRDIVKEYYYKYPDKITLLLWEHNVGADINSLALLQKLKSEYVAVLEGDDYWINDRKLEKQISFLETNKNYIATGHNVKCVNETGDLLHRNFDLYPIRDEHIYGSENAKRFELAAQTASMVYRNFVKDWNEIQWKSFFQCKANGDKKISVLLGLQGDVFFMKDIMAAHRRVFKGDSWTAKTTDRNLLWVLYQFHKNIQQYVTEIFKMKLNLEDNCKALYNASCQKFMENPNIDNFKVLYKLYKEKIKNAK